MGSRSAELNMAVDLDGNIFHTRPSGTLFRIGMDLDGVLRDWEGELSRVWERLTGTPKDHTSMSWNLVDKYKHPDHDVREIAFGSHAKLICAGAPPMPGALEGLNALARLPNCEIIIVTAHDPGPSIAASLNWIAKHELPVAGVLFTGLAGTKVGVPCDVNVDDAPHHAELFEKAMRPHVLFDAPYNRHVLPSPFRVRARGWDEVVAAVDMIYGAKHGVLVRRTATASVTLCGVRG